MEDSAVYPDSDVVKPPGKEKRHDIPVFRSLNLPEMPLLPQHTGGHRLMTEVCMLPESYPEIFPVIVHDEAPAIESRVLSPAGSMSDEQIVVYVSHD